MSIKPEDELYWSNIRSSFPVLGTKIHNKPLVYFDNAASAQKPQIVIDAIKELYETHYANVHRGIHYLSDYCTREFENARVKTAQFLGVSDSRSIVFNSGTTMGVNTVARGLAQAYLQAGDYVVITEMEHHANIVPWQHACEATGAELVVLPLTHSMEIDWSAAEKWILHPKTKVLAFTWVSNATGVINDASALIGLAKKNNVVVLVDAAQAVPHMPVNIDNLHCDFLVFSTHKVIGPSGLGVLYISPEWQEKLPPLLGGGDMIDEVYFDRTTYQQSPHKFEAGTPPIASVIAWSSAIEFLVNIGMEAVFEREKYLYNILINAFSERFPTFFIPGNIDHKAAVLSFLPPGVHPSDLGTLLDKQGIAIRTGHHCTQPLMRRMKVPGTARASLAFYNNPEEIAIFVKAIEKSLALLN
jgi:cysteine desulfurase/selenocysteine lyase